jgi:hypothetical protein
VVTGCDHDHDYDLECVVAPADYETRIYDYKGQPESVQFNLVMFANALIAADLVGKEEAEAALLTYSEVGFKSSQVVFAAGKEWSSERWVCLMVCRCARTALLGSAWVTLSVRSQ